MDSGMTWVPGYAVVRAWMNGTTAVAAGVPGRCVRYQISPWLPSRFHCGFSGMPAANRDLVTKYVQPAGKGSGSWAWARANATAAPRSNGADEPSVTNGVSGTVI